MTWIDRRLSAALALSLLLHALPLLPAFLVPAPPPKRPPPLEARLHIEPPPAALPEQPPLMLPAPPKPAKAKAEPRPLPPKPEKAEKPRPAKPSRTDWSSEVKRQLKDLERQGKFYPAEAIAQGLQGEALVLLVLDEAGNPVAARIETSSGYRILDDAALRAVRSLHSLPANAPRETLLPVRFKLR
ncbi:MAG TPA: energy transducer TonB [Rhodocyclaceae bacterium]|nr:energy transducer TonB [Rhodocyclaceae bacterium]